MGWVGVPLLVLLHMQRYRCAAPFISPSNSPSLQLHLALTDATFWTGQYNGFNYEEFWEFVVDFFEADGSAEAQDASNKLLDWWNMYIFIPTLISVVANEHPTEKSSQGPRPHAMRPRCVCGGHASRPCNNSVRPLALLTHPRSYPRYSMSFRLNQI